MIVIFVHIAIPEHVFEPFLVPEYLLPCLLPLSPTSDPKRIVFFRFVRTTKSFLLLLVRHLLLLALHLLLLVRHLFLLASCYY